MIRFVFGKDLPRVPDLAETMFQDRAGQFHRRLAWDVRVDDNGWERDRYDTDQALYCIYELPDGTHGGSGRLMPTTGRTMLNDHFTHLSDGVHIESPLIWESTRFCASPRLSGGLAQAKKISTALMLAGCEVALRFGLSHYVAVFDAPMRRIYRATGWPPEIIGTEGHGRDALCLGLWEVTTEARAAILEKMAEPMALDSIPNPTPMALAAPSAGDAAHAA